VSTEPRRRRAAFAHACAVSVAFALVAIWVTRPLAAHLFDHSLVAYRRALRRKGTLVMVGASSERLLRALLQVLLLGPVLNRLGSKQVRLCVFKSDPRDYPMLSELLESGKLVPVIDRAFPLAETAEALRYLESGHPRGKIVITVS